MTDIPTDYPCGKSNKSGSSVSRPDAVAPSQLDPRPLGLPIQVAWTRWNDEAGAALSTASLCLR